MKEAGVRVIQKVMMGKHLELGGEHRELLRVVRGDDGRCYLFEFLLVLAYLQKTRVRSEGKGMKGDEKIEWARMRREKRDPKKVVLIKTADVNFIILFEGRHQRK